MGRVEKTYHPNFLEYQKYIVEHENYRGFPEPYSDGKKVKWVAAASSDLGKKRKAWWLKKKDALKDKDIEIPKHANLSPTCLVNHPTKEKPCQTCGRVLSLEYVYPTKLTIKAINKLYSKSYDESECNAIFELIDFIEAGGSDVLGTIHKIFPDIGTCETIDDVKKNIYTEYVTKFSRKLSPGAMSNCPDRYDGFHSYNKCCRSTEDTGRHSENLQRYGEDRRAYENWADGDWKAASWLMKVYSRHRVSADHIGPISLGFCHRPVFQPMSQSENSSKGNRMSMADFHRLIKDEKAGSQIISWHSKPLWDRLKLHINNENDVLLLCKYLRRNMHYVLSIFAELNNAGYSKFLESLLHPEYANYSIHFEGFNPEDGSYTKMIKNEGNKKQYANNRIRYIRIAFEQLDAYSSKSNRNVKDLDQEIIDDALKAFKKDSTREKLLEIFDDIAERAEIEFKNHIDLVNVSLEDGS